MSTSLSRRAVPLAWEPARVTDSRYLSYFQPAQTADADEGVEGEVFGVI